MHSHANWCWKVSGGQISTTIPQRKGSNDAISCYFGHFLRQRQCLTGSLSFLAIFSIFSQGNINGHSRIFTSYESENRTETWRLFQEQLALTKLLCVIFNTIYHLKFYTFLCTDCSIEYPQKDGMSCYHKWEICHKPSSLVKVHWIQVPSTTEEATVTNAFLWCLSQPG